MKKVANLTANRLSDNFIPIGCGQKVLQENFLCHNMKIHIQGNMFCYNIFELPTLSTDGTIKTPGNLLCLKDKAPWTPLL